MASLISAMQCKSRARNAFYLLTSQAQSRERETDKKPSPCRAELKCPNQKTIRRLINVDLQRDGLWMQAGGVSGAQEMQVTFPASPALHFPSTLILSDCVFYVCVDDKLPEITAVSSYSVLHSASHISQEPCFYSVLEEIIVPLTAVLQQLSLFVFVFSVSQGNKQQPEAAIQVT